MKIVYSGYKNQKMVTMTEYVENALSKLGNEVIFFNNRAYVIPGRIRQRIKFFEWMDLKRINAELLGLVKKFQPDIFLETGGFRIFLETVKEIRKYGVTAVLWTIDVPIHFEMVLKAAPFYDYIFTGGSEAYEIFQNAGLRKLHFLPFACDPDFHNPQELNEEDKRLYGYDVSFVGSIHPNIYPFRIKTLEALTDYDLAVWGPGANTLSPDFPLRPFIKGAETQYRIWTKIYSASRISLCMHYQDPHGRIPSYQASPKVYEIMACKGFLAVDNQRDVLRLFRDKQELVVFHDVDELKSLINYYLKNPDERCEIAENGYKTVMSKHTYVHRIQEMFSIINKVG